MGFSTPKQSGNFGQALSYITDPSKLNPPPPPPPTSPNVVTVRRAGNAAAATSGTKPSATQDNLPLGVASTGTKETLGA